jgi:hypothetical protein
MNHGRKTFGTRALAPAIAGVSAVIVIGCVSAFAAVPRARAAKPLLVVRPGIRGLSVAAGSLAPGDTVQRTAILVNAGAGLMSGVSAAVSPSASSAPPPKLQVRVDRCPVAWMLSGSRLVCAKPSVQLAGWQTPTGRPMSLAGSAGLKPLATLQLRLSVRLPASLGAASEAQTGAVSWTFTGW